jgi:Zn finger protein HypA/HybF involved in hydrogenase expression
MKAENFIEKAKAVHGDRYDYSKTSAIPTKVEIVCPKHGSFIQSPDNHLKGSGCPKCASKN